MNKILNWTFGACFRTLGRFLAIFIVGALLLFVGSKLDIELPSWLTLNVKASEFKGQFYGNFYDSNGTSLNNSSAYPGFKILTSNTSSTDIYYNNNQSISSGLTIPNGSLYYYNDLIITNSETTSFVCSVESDLSVFESSISGLGNENIPSFEDYEYNITSLDCLDNKYNYLLGLSYSGSNYYGTQYCEILNIQNNTGHAVVSFRCPILSNVNTIYRLKIFSSNAENNYYLNTQHKFYIDSSSSIVDQQQQTNDKLDDMNQTQNEIKDSITNDSTTGAEDSASGFFNDFTTETFGLTSIITAPLNAINSLISSTCSPLVLPLPFVNKNLSLPCMSNVYSQYFGGFFTLYQLITTGLISYYIIVRIFNLVKDFKNPEHDEIEVMDL